jgi:hypothetical protein
MNQEQKLVFRADSGPRYDNLWVLALLAALWILSIALHVPGMP